MTAWLAVTLIAPLASFGERAGNVERSTAERPTRSALIGLAGAALGICRADNAGQQHLAASFRVASATMGTGTLVSDFHTYQSLPSASKPAPQTRAEVLARRGELNTSITRREYRADAGTRLPMHRRRVRTGPWKSPGKLSAAPASRSISAASPVRSPRR